MPADFGNPLEEAEKLIRGIRRDIKEAKEAVSDDDIDYALLEKLRGRELAALRLRSNIVQHNQKLTVRLLDSPEWQALANAIVAAVVDCDDCSEKLMRVLEQHNAKPESEDNG